MVLEAVKLMCMMMGLTSTVVGSRMAQYFFVSLNNAFGDLLLLPLLL